MKYKKWSLAVLILVVLVFAGIAGMNYVVDPFGYFTFRSGDYEDIDFQADTTYYQRMLKAKHVQNFSENYDAYLLGGSKAGSYQPETLSKMDGYRYFNMFELGGNFSEYETTVRYLLQTAAPKKIVLSISGGEIRSYTKDSKNLTFRIPAVMTGGSELKEFVDFLFLDANKGFDRLQERSSGKTYYELMKDGSRNIQKYYKSLAADPDAYVQRRVLKPFAKHMYTLFETNTEREYYQASLDSLKRIKNMCNSAGVEFMVIVAPAFIGEMSEHDTTYYRDYLLNMAAITDYWDFSGYNDIDMNPYNYYNEGHFYYEIAELIVDTITGTDSYPGFGTYVTRYNAAEHIAQRTADYERLKQEYETTGTIALQGMQDASFILGRAESE